MPFFHNLPAFFCLFVRTIKRTSGRTKRKLMNKNKQNGIDKNENKNYKIITTGTMCAQPLPLFQMKKHDQTRICVCLVDRIMITSCICKYLFFFVCFHLLSQKFNYVSSELAASISMFILFCLCSF